MIVNSLTMDMKFPAEKIKNQTIDTPGNYVANAKAADKRPMTLVRSTFCRHKTEILKCLEQKFLPAIFEINLVFGVNKPFCKQFISLTTNIVIWKPDPFG